MHKRRAQKKIIPERLGSGAAHVWPYIFGLFLNALLHTSLFFLYQRSVYSAIYLFISFLFFIYPFYYVTDVLWSLRPSICDILSGNTLINRTYYMNTMRRNVDSSHYFSLTISIPVYTEDNDVIFETITRSVQAAERYAEVSGRRANIIVSDDGIAPLLGGMCSFERVEELFEMSRNSEFALSVEEKKVLDRVAFYRRKKVGFVVRPAKGRKGLFKKASNLNYTIKLGNAFERGAGVQKLFGEGGEFCGGYAEGDVITNEVILLLDKDSGVPERIAECVVPEFYFDNKLAYIQCATKAMNMSDNYYTYATAHQVNNLFFNIWPCKALQGFFVPLVGHNVFLRKDFLEKSGLWAENKVSEDYDKAISFYNMGYHGKYAQLKGLEFTEYVSRCFVEETAKQHRYAYGLFEMIFDGTLVFNKTRKCDIFYMFLYFFSFVNEVMLLPTVLIESYFGNIHILWAGFIVCNVCFIILPCIRGLIMRRRIPQEHTEKMMHTFIIAVSFVGHSFSMLSGALRYIGNKIRSNSGSFPSSSVDRLNYGFKEGMKFIIEFIRKNKGFLFVSMLCIDRGIFMLTRKGIEPMTVITYSYILFGTVLSPFFLTPQLFIRKKILENVKNANGYEGDGKGRRIETDVQSGRRDVIDLTDAESGKKLNSRARIDSDINEFLDFYHSRLQEGILREGMPVGIVERYGFESCVKRDEEGRKQIYLLRRKDDGRRAVLRITADYAEEDALDEARILEKLDHKYLPKVLEAFEENGKKYMIREYVEGRSLHEVIKSNGVFGTRDIFDIVMKLVDILHYLHSQSPPVIHRDIKPQNIILDKEGNVHLIDFGIARLHKKGRTQDTFVVLTLDYAPPEQYGFDQTSTLTDIYSTGIVMLFMATGNLLRSELEAQIINNRLRNLILKCIALDPKYRIQSVGEIASYIQKSGTKNKGRIRLAAATCLLFTALGLSSVSYVFGVHKGESLGRKAGYEMGFGVGYTDGFEDAPVLEFSKASAIEGKIGNSRGNMSMEGGSFAVAGSDRIFYVLDGDIYSMANDGSDFECIVKGENASNLSYYNGWLYYRSEGDIVQTNIYNFRRDVILKDGEGMIYIEDEKYYIVDDRSLHIFDPSSAEMKKLADLKPHKYLNIFRGHLLFASKESGKLEVLKIAGSREEESSNSSEDTIFLTKMEESAAILAQSDVLCTGICVYKNSLYCCIEDEFMTRLIRIDSGSKDEKKHDSDSMQMISELNAKAFQVADQGVYYIDATDGTLRFCSMDGRFKMRISGNQVGSFNIAGDWIFYRNQSDEDSLWCVRTDATDDHRVRSRR